MSFFEAIATIKYPRGRKGDGSLRVLAIAGWNRTPSLLRRTISSERQEAT